MFDASPEVFYEQTVASTWQASVETAPGRQTLGTPRSAGGADRLRPITLRERWRRYTETIN